jgi:hypothetical protein
LDALSATSRGLAQLDRVVDRAAPQTEPIEEAKPRPRDLLGRTQHSVHRGLVPERQRLQQER